MDRQPSITILSTRHLGNDIVQRAARKRLPIQISNLIETEGILQPEDAKALMDWVEKESRPVMLLLTSMNGVKWLKKGLLNAGYIFPQGITALCVGKKTASRAAEQLKVLPLLIAPNGAELLTLIKKHVPVNTHIIYPCAQSRLDTLPEGLKEAGYGCTEFSVYITRQVPRKIEGTFTFILFFSPSAVEAYFEKNAWPSETMGVCIGNTTAEALRKKGVERILVAASPDELSMLEAIEKFIHKG